MKELNKKSDYKFYVAIHRTIGMMLSEDLNSVNRLMNILGIGFRIIDEAHSNFSSTCQIESLSNVEYTLYLTATPSRSSFREDTLYAKVYQKVPYFNGREEAISNYHTVIIREFDSKPSQNQRMAVKTQYGLSTPRWSDYIEGEAYDIFYENLHKLLTSMKVLERKKKTVMMLPKISFIKKLELDLANDFLVDVGVYIGEKSADEKADALTKPLILTNDKIFEKGIDLPDLEVLINAVPFSSTTKLEQIIGRLRYGENKSSIYIDMADVGFPQIVNQLKIRKTFYRKNAKRIIEIKNK